MVLLRRYRELVDHTYTSLLLLLLRVNHVVHLGRVAVHYATGTGTCIKTEILLRRHVLWPDLLHTPIFIAELRLAL